MAIKHVVIADTHVWHCGTFILKATFQRKGQFKTSSDCSKKLNEVSQLYHAYICIYLMGAFQSQFQTWCFLFLFPMAVHITTFILRKNTLHRQPANHLPYWYQIILYISSSLFKLLTPAVLYVWFIFSRGDSLRKPLYIAPSQERKTESAEVKRTPAECRYQVMMFAVLTWASFLSSPVVSSPLQG